MHTPNDGSGKGLLLNATFVADRLRELDLKQWWVAEQVGVDRKTVTRWINGHVKRIQPDNLKRLAACLECEEKSLAIADERDVFATPAEQVKAAHLIEREGLLETLGPPGQWRMLQSLIKATLRPELPLRVLGQLYNHLSISAWRQSDLKGGEKYAKLALETGERCGSQSVVASAKLNLATLAAFRGRLPEALHIYAECLRLCRFLDDDLTRAKAMLNYGAVCLDAGDPIEAAKWQKKAIRAFARLKKPMNESIAWCGLADAYLSLRRFTAAMRATVRAEIRAKEGGYRRGLADAALQKTEIELGLGRLDEAEKSILRARKRFERLGIRESRLEMVAARLARLRGNHDEARRHLAVAWRLAKGFPIELAAIKEERAALMGSGKES